MPRRKHALEDSYSSDDDTPQERGITQRDLEDEAEQFRDPTHSGRRKRTKEDVIYGSFIESGSEDERGSGRRGNDRSKARRREGFEFVAASSSASSSRPSKPSKRLDHDHFDDDDQGSSDSDGSQSPQSRNGGDDKDMDIDSDQESSDSDEEEARLAREAAFKARQRENQQEFDEYEDKAAPTTSMRSRLGIGLAPPGLGAPAASTMTTPETPDMDGQESTPSSPAPLPAANKVMAATIRASLGLSSQPSSPSGSGNNTPRNNRNKHAGQSSSLSAFINRAGLNPANSDSSPSSSRPSTPTPATSATSRSKPSAAPGPTLAPVQVARDYGAFSAKGSGFGMKMLEKMGWKMGYGLGAGGEGIVEPIQTKLRPVKMGIGFKGFKEKTDQDRAEEKRRGYAVSSEEDEEDEKAKKKKQHGDKRDKEVKSDGWKKTAGGSRGGKRKLKVEYKTAAEIQQEIESADLPMTQAQPQKILDMTGKTVRELTSASQISSAIVKSHERFPELRHNMELMADISTTDLEHLARKQKADHVRQQILEKEGARIQKLVTQDVDNLERLVKVMSLTEQCEQIMNEIRQSTSDTTGEVAVDMQEALIERSFQEPFELFAGLYYEEYKVYELDQVVIASIQDSFKRLYRDWDVLPNPRLGAGLFRKWQKLLRTSRVAHNHTQGMLDRDGIPVYGGKPHQTEKMTAYESLLNHQWLPKVRSAINNHWDARDCDPVIELLEAWEQPLLPAFMHDNIITQLIMPKLVKEVEKWSPRDTLMLHTFILPWLPIIGEDRLEQELFGDVRRKLASGLLGWNVLDESGLHVLQPWQGVFDPSDMELLLLKSVLPKLVEGLQMLEINPRDQKIEIFDAVMPWHSFFPSTTFSSLLVNEFFPKWHQVLYLWLTHDSTTDLGQIYQWYEWWKTRFPATVLQDPAVVNGFKRGLDMLNQAMSGLKVMVPTDLAQARAQARAQASSSLSNGRASSSSLNPLERLQTKKHLAESVTFKDLVQKYATENSLLFVMTKLTHERSGRPLYRLGGNSTGTSGGILVHMTEEVAFVKMADTGVWMPMGLEEMMVLAGGGQARQ
ncbi:hypothetical protein BGZ83_002154 [Gryganskiella cystojenkinii]|nr:hypothetical protein BGZ83_002154 [Gryganskiella cystojenkinii]